VVDLSTLVVSYGYIGVFLASFLGSASIIFPIPYLIVFYYLGASHLLNPILISIIGGIGATFGEFILYAVGYSGRKIVSERTIKNLEYFKQAIDKYGPIIIFIFAATPLPDDIIYPILGIMKYNIMKISIACFLGKTILTGIVVYSGYFSYEYISLLLGSNNILSSVIVAILAAIFTVIVIKVDWSRIFRIGVRE